MSPQELDHSLAACIEEIVREAGDAIQATQMLRDEGFSVERCFDILDDYGFRSVTDYNESLTYREVVDAYYTIH